MDIQSVLNSAGGARAIAEQLGIDEATAQRGVDALLPHVVEGVETQGVPTDAVAGAMPQGDAGASAIDGGGLGGILGGLLGGGGGGGGGLLGGMLGGGLGNQVLGHIFGSKDGSREVAADASQRSGVDPSILKKILPILAAMVAMHYMTHRGQTTAPIGDAQSEPAGGGGILGSILGKLGS